MGSVRGALWNALQALGLGCLLAPAVPDVRAASGDVVWSYSAPSNTVVMGPGFGADGTAYSLGMAGPGELSVSAISTNGVVGWSRVPNPAGPGVWSSIPPSAILAPGGDIQGAP